MGRQKVCHKIVSAVRKSVELFGDFYRDSCFRLTSGKQILG